MHRRPSTASASLVGRVTVTLHGPIGELAAALRILADALDQEQVTRTVTYTATVAPQARGPAPGGITASLADRFVAQLTPAAVEVLVVLCRHAPEVTCAATGSSRLPPGSSWVRWSALARLDWLPGEARPMLSLPARPARLDRPPPGRGWRRSRRLRF
jgi:hypothetical protein